ncbi:hypothetical protein B0H16DRAFT_1436434, partial [Mycena metata]
MKYMLCITLFSSVVGVVSALPLAVATGGPAIRASETCGGSTNAVPFYRSFASSVVDHFYTAQVTLVNNAVNVGSGASGFLLEEVAGLVFATQEESTVPFYRLGSAAATDNFYTISTAERDAALQNGYSVFANDPNTYIYPTQICGSVPFYRLFSAAGQDNFYTTSESERLDFILNRGYADVEIAGYVLPVLPTQCI